jgi:AraC-like DNA-binding protein
MAIAIHRTFDDPGAYEQTVRQAHVSGFSVSERGTFDAELTIVDLDRLWLQRGSDNLARTTNVTLMDKRRPVMFLADRQVPSILHSGVAFGTDDVVIYGEGSSHLHRTFGPNRWASLSLPTGYLEEAVRVITDTDLGDPSASLWVRPSSAQLNRLRHLHNVVIQMNRPGEPRLRNSEVLRSLEQSLTVAMVACLTEGRDQRRTRGWHRHQQIMWRFAEWLEANTDRPVYLQEICVALNVSAPTLNRCCAEHLRMSPMRYLWLRRMNLARRALQQKNHSSSVTAIAMEFGFWHLGRFSEEYRSLFSELPSATLERQSLR